MLGRILLAAMAVLATVTAHGQAYPSRPIKVLHGFAAGGPPDVALRRIAAQLERRLGQPVVVENRPGASGTIAAASVARAEPDGYTLLFGVAANLAVAPALMSRPPYDPPRAFAPIVEVARGPYVWLVRSDAPARSMPEFLAWAKRASGKLNYGTPGVGSVHHLATEMLKRNTGIEMLHVPYTTGGLYAGLLGGQIDAMFESLPGPLPHIAAGKLRALAVTGHRRLSALPDVPTLAEQGVTDIDVNSWWGFVGPKGLPGAIATRLNEQIAAALAEPSVKQAFDEMGIEPSPGSPQAFGDYIDQEYARWRKAARELSVRLD